MITALVQFALPSRISLAEATKRFESRAAAEAVYNGEWRERVEPPFSRAYISQSNSTT